MNEEKIKITLTFEHRGRGSTTFTGRPQGKDVRKQLKLDEKDSDIHKYDIALPEGTTSFNPSFYLGLFFPSIKKLNGIEPFKEKYNLSVEKIEEGLKELLIQHIQECEREASNEYEGITGLDSIF